VTKLEIALEECLARIDIDGASVDEVLANYPQLQADLRPMLLTAQKIRAAAAVKPNNDFKNRNRAALSAAIRSNPRRTRSAWQNPFALRVAGSLAVLALALISATTVSAQSALPGQALYAWKLGSERVWRNWQSDLVSADLFLGNRRLAELQAVKGFAEHEQIAVDQYALLLEQLARDLAASDAQKKIDAQVVLNTHKDVLNALVVESSVVAENLEKLFSLLPTLDGSPEALPTPTAEPAGDNNEGGLVLPAVPTLSAPSTGGREDQEEGNKEDEGDSTWFEEVITDLLGSP
jgi:hypothetical protein